MRAPTTLTRDLCTHPVVAVAADATLADCARVMRHQHVGALVVQAPGGGRHPAAGMLTDRDIVVASVAAGLDPATLTAGDVMSTPLATVRDDDDVLDALARMREHGVRRLAVLNAQHTLVGVITLDDVLQALAQQIDAVVGVLRAEQGKESALRPATATARTP